MGNFPYFTILDTLGWVDELEAYFVDQRANMMERGLKNVLNMRSRDRFLQIAAV